MKRKIVTKLMAIVLAGVLLTGSVTPGAELTEQATGISYGEPCKSL